MWGHHLIVHKHVLHIYFTEGWRFWMESHLIFG